MSRHKLLEAAIREVSSNQSYQLFSNIHKPEVRPDVFDHWLSHKLQDQIHALASVFSDNYLISP